MAEGNQERRNIAAAVLERLVALQAELAALHDHRPRISAELPQKRGS